MAAAEVSVGLALVLQFQKHHPALDNNSVNQMRG
jgi:NADH:ubiquinone oxidoreductase subunit K